MGGQVPPWERDALRGAGPRTRKAVPMVTFRIPADAKTTGGKPGISATGVHYRPGQVISTSDPHLIRALHVGGAETLDGKPLVAAPSEKHFRSLGFSHQDARAKHAYEKVILTPGGTPKAAQEASDEARAEYKRELREVRERQENEKQGIREILNSPIPTMEELQGAGAPADKAHAVIAAVTAVKEGATLAEAQKAHDKMLASFVDLDQDAVSWPEPPGRPDESEADPEDDRDDAPTQIVDTSTAEPTQDAPPQDESTDAGESATVETPEVDAETAPKKTEPPAEVTVNGNARKPSSRKKKTRRSDNRRKS